MKNQAWAMLWALAFLVLGADARSGKYKYHSSKGERVGYEIDSNDRRSIITAWSKTASPVDGGYTVWLQEVTSGCAVGTKMYSSLSKELVDDETKNQLYIKCLIASGAVQ